MPWESDNGQDEAGRDWPKVMWLGLALILVIMIAWLYLPKDRPTSLTRARVWHILVTYDRSEPGQREAALETANSLRKRIIEGESFSKVAKEYSGDVPSARRGGDLGWVGRGTLSDALDAVIWDLPLNQISKMFESVYGVHLVLVSDREIAEADLYERELHKRVLKESTGGAGR